MIKIISHLIPSTHKPQHGRGGQRRFSPSTTRVLEIDSGPQTWMRHFADPFFFNVKCCIPAHPFSRTNIKNKIFPPMGKNNF